MFDTRTRLLFFACLKDAAGAALKSAAPAPTSKKIGSGSRAALKVAAPAVPAPGSATLAETGVFSKTKGEMLGNEVKYKAVDRILLFTVQPTGNLLLA